MRRKRFRLLHSLLGVTAAIVVEAIFGAIVRNPAIDQYGIMLLALLVGTGIIVVAMEAIEEVRNARHMLVLLSIVVVEFIVFFAFQYGYVSLVAPGTFQGLTLDPITLLLHSTMIFAFNPLYLSATLQGKALMLINTLESMALVIFVLQNVWQFHGGSQRENVL